MTHYPFDDGALDAIAAATGQKTIKAACATRVRFADARADAHVSCLACRRAIEARIATGEALLASLVHVDEATKAAIAATHAHLRAALDR